MEKRLQQDEYIMSRKKTVSAGGVTCLPEQPGRQVTESGGRQEQESSSSFLRAGEDL